MMKTSHPRKRFQLRYQKQEADGPSLVDRWLAGVKNRPVFAGIIFLAIVISGATQLIGGVSQLTDVTVKFLSKFGLWEETVQITGMWEHPIYGPMRLQQEGNRVTGTYEYSRQNIGFMYGELEGEITGRHVEFKWCQDTIKEVPCKKRKMRGDGYFILSQDGNSTEGQWRADYEKEWRADWNLKRK